MSTMRISDYARFWEDEDDVVQRLLDEWQPSAQGLSEKQYKQELYNWLTAKLPDVPMVAQYEIAKGRADIVLQESHVIEVKLKLCEASDLDQCIGQLERYRSKWIDQSRGPVYLVILGESDPELRDVLHGWWTQTWRLLRTWFYICEKRPGDKSGTTFWESSGAL